MIAETLGETLDGRKLEAPPDPDATQPPATVVAFGKPLSELVYRLTADEIRATPPRRDFLLTVCGTGEGAPSAPPARCSAVR